jgi:hypothetical protein
MKHQAALYSLQEIDIYQMKVRKNIYYIEDKE